MGVMGAVANDAYSTNTTTFCPVAQGAKGNAETTEANAALSNRVTGTYSYLWVFVSANALTLATTTITSRKNSGAGNLSISITAGSTGAFSDTTNSDVLSTPGDTWDSQTAIPLLGANTITIRSTRATFQATSNHVVYFCANVSGSGLSYSTASTTWKTLPNSLTTNSALIAAFFELKYGVAATWQYLQCRVSSNGRGTATSFFSVLNNVAGNQAISVGAAATGLFEDTTNNDAFGAGTQLSNGITTSTGAGTLTLNLIASAIISKSTNANVVAGSTTDGVSRTAGGTANFYYASAGTLENVNTETASQIVPGFATTLSKFLINIVANAYTGTATADVRKNSGSGSETISIGAGVTGQLQDTTNTDTFAATDTLNHRVINGTANTMSINHFSVISTPTLTGASRSQASIVG